MKNVARMVKERRPQATVHMEKLHVTSGHVRLKPDLVVTEGNQVTIVDFAVTWDANEGILIQMCAAKRAKYASLKTCTLARTSPSSAWRLEQDQCSAVRRSRLANALA
ncbi:hypothetical protein MTO96_015787 [Rhipicephalus appendiculatus]